MSFETWCETQAAMNAGAAEMRKPMACGHPKACFGVKGSLLSEDDIFKAKPTCRWCAELAALKAERDKLRAILEQMMRHRYEVACYCANCEDARILLASAPKKES